MNPVNTWEESVIRNLNPPDCVANLIIFTRLSPYLSNQVHEARDIAESPSLDKNIIMRTLIDTGANLSFISISLSDKLEKELLGVRGIGNYKVTDAFLKAYYFKDNLTFRIRLNTGDTVIDSKSWLITAVIVNIDFTADFLLGLSDIKKIKLFRYLPECVEESDDIQERNQTENDESDTRPNSLIGMTNRTNPVTTHELLSKKSEIHENIESGTIRYSECQEEMNESVQSRLPVGLIRHKKDKVV